MAAGWTYERYPSSYPLCGLYFGETEWTFSEPVVVDAREETIVDKNCTLFEGAGYCLVETFLVTDLAEEIVAVDNDDLLVWKLPRLHWKLVLGHYEVFGKLTDKV